MKQYCHSPDGIEPLTAAHLLIGRGLMAYLETEVDLSMAQTERWTLCQQIVQGFWKRWSRECLSQMQAHYKWRKKRPNLAVGDVVLLRDKTYFQTHWGLARVVELFPGKDGLVRSVDVVICKVKQPEKMPKRKNPLSRFKSRKTTLRRPITSLSLLLKAGRVLPSGGRMSEPKSSSDRRPLEGRAAAGSLEQIRIIIIRHCIISHMHSSYYLICTFARASHDPWPIK